MKVFRQAYSLLLVGLISSACSLQFADAASAQGTVLTGKVSSIHQPSYEPLVARPADFDDRYAPPPRLNAGTTYVNPPSARAYRPQRPLVRTVYVQDNRTFFQRHPKVKAASIGAGVGAGAGALTGLVTGHGVLRGAAIGGGAGAGVGLVRSSQTLKRHPIMRDVATGSLVGLGLGAAGSHGSRRALQATGVGAAVGLGVGMFKHLR